MCKKKKKEMYCPYCGTRARLVTRREVYGHKELYGKTVTNPEEKIWICGNFEKGCDSYVGTHKGTNIPYGTLANAKLRRLRIEAHKSIDRVVEAGIMDKHSVYDYLEISLGFPKDNFHIGNSGEYFCKKVIEIMDGVLQQRDEVQAYDE